MEPAGATMLPARLALVIVDGLGDVSVPSLGLRTPLAAAATPCLDVLASAGLNGLLDPVAPGVACGSDAAHLSLLGYDPAGAATGRGAFEALGAGLAMRPGDVAFKCNFAVWDPATGLVTSRRADRHFEEDGPVLCAALDGLLLPPPCDGDGPVEVRCAYATEHRAGLLLRSPGRGLSARVTGTDPLRDGRPLLASAPADGPASAEGARSARAVNAACAALRAALAVHPLTAARARAGRPTANVLLLRGPGGCATERPFAEVHPRWGAPAVVAPTRMIAGLALALRCALLPVAGATGDYRTDLAAKAAAGAAVLRPGSPHRLLLLHVKAVDDAGHDRNVAHRVAYLQAVDAMVGQLCARLWADRLGSEGGAEACLVAVTGDHSTPVLYGDHGAEPVPLAVAHLADWVAAAGGAAALAAWPMGPIPTPEFEAPPLAPGPRPRPPAGRDPGVAAVAGDGVTAFDECAAALGGLGRFPGSQLMSLLTRLAETRAETRGE